jgi:transcriptional regulator GlxA family with amidase domain
MIEQVRVSAARRLLELGREAPKKVAVDCGFANAVTRVAPSSAVLG